MSCIDGRFQTETIGYLQRLFGVENIDSVTTAGAVRHLAGEIDQVGEVALNDISVSVNAHDSRQIAIVAHADCAGNPVTDAEQKDQLTRAASVLRARFARAEVVAVFVDADARFTRVV